MKSYKFLKLGICTIMCCMFTLILQASFAQNTVTGVVRDSKTNEPLIAVSILENGTSNGVLSDVNGKFAIVLKKMPSSLTFKYVGYEDQLVDVKLAGASLTIKMVSKTITGKEVKIIDSRITEKQKESALTVEAMDLIAIKETPAANFYDGLGQLKGVDLTSASIGFKVINTRGFNSTSPVRSLQVIDGVDNQAPGLNFSLGNFLGASELDVLKVDIIAGASGAYYGPNAFNGVIAMKTKNPFLHTGTSFSVKGGERNLFEGMVRHAQAYKNKNGKDIFAYKLNLYYLRADDWVANNLDPVYESAVTAQNWGGFDAVNRYGDEPLAGGNDYTQRASRLSSPGLGTFYRTGYNETDLVDYDTRNLKLATALHFKLKPDVELIVASNFGYGTTVYHGENRFSLKDIQFFQNRIEVAKENKFFFRVYASNEDAGNSYDAVRTAFLMQEMSKSSTTWNIDYAQYWNVVIRPRLRTLPGFPPLLFNDTHLYLADSVMKANPALLQAWHNETRNNADNSVSSTDEAAFYEPGTQRFDSLFNHITTTTYDQGGSRFFDKSALYHAHGEYKFNPTFGEITVGANSRLYRPNSNGTIFNDTAGITISNYEFGVYSGVEKRLMAEKMKINATVRLDKNQNFQPLVSPAASVVYSPNKEHTFRLSFSSAIRNPTLADQYLYFDVGRAILLGNLNGIDSLVTVESFGNYRNTLNTDTLVYFNVAPIKPEKVRSVEIGWRATLWKKVFVDASYYFSYYQDFIGFNLGIDLEVDPFFGFPTKVQPYRVSANATDIVTTQGFSAGVNYFFAEGLSLNGNYSFNALVNKVDDPIIPAFNTPRNKFNIGVSGRQMPKHIGFWDLKNFGFNINYKWIQGFEFQGSPQFTGPVDTYDLLDVQVNQQIKKMNIKLGASNLLNNNVFQVYGGPRVGRMTYLALSFAF